LTDQEFIESVKSKLVANLSNEAAAAFFKALRDELIMFEEEDIEDN
jgi:hypothetical protein